MQSEDEGHEAFDHQVRDLVGQAAYDYFAGGAGSEITLRDNRASWSRIALAPRVLCGVGERDTGVTLLGRPRRHPVLVAPMAYQRHAHSDGELAMARGAAASGTPLILSSQTTTPPADVARLMGGTAHWMQLYVFRDRALSFEIVDAAREGGYEALVITVDFPLGGRRDREIASGFTATHPTFLDHGEDMSPAVRYTRHDPDLTWDDIADFADASGLPVVLKGILHPVDARIAADAGVAGIVVSNHGGRQLDTVLSGADALGPVVDAVNGRVDVLVDGGVRRGWDVAKALALGASGVLVGRHALWGLARAGAAGVERVLTDLVAEFDSTLALLGCRTPTELGREHLLPAPWA
ncbi:alpha-hydroxy acid oxidase [uncultured Aeromicrobium sp.]|uniref:alpha-hydroxy acid oxidase n=1 Tax=uncultured Aeromicrobium sp. TaxID=337820 RepID=UPI0025DD368C|nr:alpha-hydroxy acid oxidase [uncultured Aeromicrobium sp.]